MREIAELNARINLLLAMISISDAELARRTDEVLRLNGDLPRLNKEIARLNSELAQLRDDLARKDGALAAKDVRILELVKERIRPRSWPRPNISQLATTARTTNLLRSTIKFLRRKPESN